MVREREREARLTPLARWLSDAHILLQGFLAEASEHFFGKEILVGDILVKDIGEGLFKGDWRGEMVGGLAMVFDDGDDKDALPILRYTTFGGIDNLGE